MDPGLWDSTSACVFSPELFPSGLAAFKRIPLNIEKEAAMKEDRDFTSTGTVRKYIFKRVYY